MAGHDAVDRAMHVGRVGEARVGDMNERLGHTERHIALNKSITRRDCALSFVADAWRTQAVRRMKNIKNEEKNLQTTNLKNTNNKSERQ